MESRSQLSVVSRFLAFIGELFFKKQLIIDLLTDMIRFVLKLHTCRQVILGLGWRVRWVGFGLGWLRS